MEVGCGRGNLSSHFLALLQHYIELQIKEDVLLFREKVCIKKKDTLNSVIMLTSTSSSEKIQQARSTKPSSKL